MEDFAKSSRSGPAAHPRARLEKKNGLGTRKRGREVAALSSGICGGKASGNGETTHQMILEAD